MSNIATILILIQTLRIGGVVFPIELWRGNIPATFAVPAGVGDILIGATAPIIAFSIRRMSTATWVTAITWNALGITDLVYAILQGFLSQAQYILTSYLVVIPTVFVPPLIIIHLVTIRLLLKKAPASLAR